MRYIRPRFNSEERSITIPPQLYWLGQAAFVVVLLAVAFSSALSDTTLFVFAAIQLALVSWRLWIAGRWPWIALAPPLSTAALWYLLGRWAIGEDTKVGGDGAGLLAVMASMAWGLAIYIAAAIWAGSRPIVSRPVESR
jgi:hypothetical protein